MPVPVNVNVDPAVFDHAVPEPVIVNVEEPNVIVFDSVVPLGPAAAAVKLKFPVLNVPAVMPNPPLALFIYASCKVTSPLKLVITVGCVNVLLALVIVWLPLPANVSSPVPLSVVPVPLIQLP